MSKKTIKFKNGTEVTLGLEGVDVRCILSERIRRLEKALELAEAQRDSYTLLAFNKVESEALIEIDQIAIEEILKGG